MFGFKKHLTRRLMAYIASSVVFALLTTATIQYLALRPLLEETRQRNINAAVENLAPLVGQALWVFNEDVARDTANAMLRDQFISGIVITDHVNLFDYRLGDLAQSEHLNPEIDEIYRNQNSQALTVVVPLTVRTEEGTGPQFNVGTLEIRSDNLLISEFTSDLATLTLASSVLVIIALLFIFYFIVQHILARPLNELTGYVHSLVTQLADSDNIEPPALSKREDEIGRLSQTFHEQRLELINRDKALKEYRDHLEQTVAKRTQELSKSNEHLIQSLEQLQKAQADLIQNEKLVSLGTLVSGIAHEVNTPVGVAITAASHLAEELRITRHALNTNKLTKSGFEGFLQECADSEALLTSNLNRAAELVQSFKQVAVDQSSEQERTINLNNYLQEIILSLRPKLKATKIEVELDVAEQIELTIPPGALAQIITNLILNSLVHGFNKGAEAGTINISGRSFDDVLELIYSDDGAGMNTDTLKHIYDPFFTTRRGDGGSGLGMNIVYNLVTSKLNGAIETRSAPGEGLKIIMTLKI